MTAEATQRLLTLLREIRGASRNIIGETLMDDEVVNSIFFAATDAINLVEGKPVPPFAIGKELEGWNE